MGIDTLEETIQLLTAGRIDATLNADVSFYDYLNVHPDADFKLVAQTAEASHVAIPVLKSEDTAYLDALNTAIEELRADGTIKDPEREVLSDRISLLKTKLLHTSLHRCGKPAAVLFLRSSIDLCNII